MRLSWQSAVRTELSHERVQSIMENAGESTKHASDGSERKALRTELSRRSRMVLVVGLTAVGILVYTVAGYNYFMDSTTRLIVRVAVPLFLFLLVILLRNRVRAEYESLLFSFLGIAAGFLLAGTLGRLYTVTESVEGYALAKVAEAVPIVVCMLLATRLEHYSFKKTGLTGGRVSVGLLLGLLVMPLALIQYVFSGGLQVTAQPLTVLGWLPWLVIFGVSNSLMEEIMFRGLFLQKLEPLLGKTGALGQTSMIFAVFHIALLPFMGWAATVIFVLFLFVHGCAWGYTMQRSDSIWGAVLAHAVADILFLIAIFGVGA